MRKNRCRYLPAFMGMLATVLMLGVFGFQAAPVEAQDGTEPIQPAALSGLRNEEAARNSLASGQANTFNIEPTASNDVIPSQIRVAITGYADGNEWRRAGYPIQEIVTISLRDYVRGVLPSEWVPTWDMDSLKAGAMAVKMFAWWRIQHPRAGNYDVVDNTYDQVFRRGISNARTDTAINETWNYSMLRNGSVIEIHYVDTDEHCQEWLPGTLCMGQWNSKAHADSGKSWEWILHHYYDPVTIAQVSSASTLTTQTSFNFRNNFHGWVGTTDLTGQGFIDSGMWFKIEDTDRSGHLDPIILGPEMVPFRADSFTHLRVVMDREITNSTCAEFFWRRAGQDFRGSQRVQFTTRADSVTETYEIDLTQNANWAGSISQVRFDPACNFGGSTAVGYVRIDRIELFNVDNPDVVATYSWDFKLQVPQGWMAINHLEGVAMQDVDRGMWARITGGDPWFNSPEFQPINAADYSEVRITMGRDQTDNCSQLYWHTIGDEDTYPNQKINFEVARDSEGTYVVPLAGHPLWAGQVTQLRFDPTCGEYDRNWNNAVRIDRIELVPVAQANPDTFQLTFDPPSATMAIGETASFNLLVENPDMQESGGIRGLDIQCEPTAAIVQGVSIEDGALFSSQAVSVLLPDPAFPPGPAFQWLISERAGESDVTETGTALNISYQGVTEGTAELACSASIIDSNGELVEGIPVATATLEVLGNGTITGTVLLDFADDNSGVEIAFHDNEGNVAGTTTTAADGSFSVELAPGVYFMTMITPGYLTAADYDVEVTSASAALPETTLYGGDVNGDDIIDLLDITQFANDFTAQQDAATPEYDITRDNSVKLDDFYAIVFNLDRTGASYTPGSN